MNRSRRPVSERSVSIGNLVTAPHFSPPSPSLSLSLPLRPLPLSPSSRFIAATWPDLETKHAYLVRSRSPIFVLSIRFLMIIKILVKKLSTVIRKRILITNYMGNRDRIDTDLTSSRIHPLKNDSINIRAAILCSKTNERRTKIIREKDL